MARSKRAEMLKRRKARLITVDMEEHKTIHCKSYVQPSLDEAVRRFQMDLMDRTGLSGLTYSEAVRRLLVMGLFGAYGIKFRLENSTFGNENVEFHD